MKKLSIILSFIIAVFIISGCNKKEPACSGETTFCSFVNAEAFNATGKTINTFLATLKSDLSDSEKIEKLKAWLDCKSCVSKAEIICVSCIKTNPPQSELSVDFISNGQAIRRILDITMSEKPKFRTYHE